MVWFSDCHLYSYDPPFTMSAIPLCLPNNCQWSEDTNEYAILPDTSRSALRTIDAALRMLRAIHGAVCIVAVAGPCRRGKSYILAKSFGDREIFPLGHLMDPQTMGLWLWIVPEKFRDSNGEEFTVVLLDSEGTDSVLSKQRDDDVIFTLTVLLSSVLIYNSTGVPRRSDLDGLDHVTKLCQRIQVFAGENTEHAHAKKVFPSFVWLLRDVLQDIPEDCENLMDYFLTKVFTPSPATADEKAHQAADSILQCFPSFDAFSLPPPSTDPRVLREMNEQSVRSKVNSSFLSGVDDFKRMLHLKLHPKRTPDGRGFITGEALATMISAYVAAVNIPGTIPSVARAWDTYIETKGTKTLQNAKVIYHQQIRDLLEHLLPCPVDMIKRMHGIALEQADEFFKQETLGMSSQSVWEYKQELLIEADQTESDWLIENNRLTQDSCDELYRSLRKEILEPVQRVWRRVEENEVAYAVTCIDSAYEGLITELQRKCRGCQELCQDIIHFKREEIEQERREDVRRIKNLCLRLDEMEAYRLAREDEEKETRKIGAENSQIKRRRREIELQIKELEVQQEHDLNALQEQMDEEFRKYREAYADALRSQQEKGELEKQDMQIKRDALARQAERLRGCLQDRQQSIEDLKAKIARL